ncbi:TetR/AcrR family transcriptional regulator [Actinomadura darangshiensis]|uniref:TetR/AcrR family transcriptional regulator n=1 Tax=Actinomadura darangshiensis TaxID=705336 RepID=A0A4R5B3K1_9ACTN|nr:TetR/AcrR family transcriptional regulator [Actinomadura darangshiensis]TDD79775.1 TetR/AcrR family transcriptional regulator [Actinomadura darangshiensis]
MTRRRSDTREQIRRVALELFAEQGYEKTSLREIAERLEVTKAALYYHFKTKEDIVASLFADFHAEAEELLEWTRGQQPTPESRRELVRRYAEIIQGPGSELIRFMQQNEPVVRELKGGGDMRSLMQSFATFLVDKETSLPDQIRARLPLFTLHLTSFAMRDTAVDEDDLQAAALEVALDLIPEQ